ncbi:MAG: hypothetical protein PHI89_00855 [Thiovulaceae bacterium]|nr:hypothetical protein [Sulfurimonadaceae bacterium]
MKKRNTCQDTNCIKEAYTTRVEELTTSLANQKESIKKAIQEARVLYEKSKNVYPSIKKLDAVGAQKIIQNSSEHIMDETYIHFLKEYAFYYIYTAEDLMHGKNLHLAIDILEKLKSITPDDAQIYLLQGRAYLRLFRFSLNTMLISSYSTEKIAHDESFRTIPPAMKATYVKYTQIAKAQNLPMELTQEEQFIVQRQRMFFDYYSNFDGKRPWYNPNIDLLEHMPKEPYKQGFENVCHEYVTMLNQMPDDNLTECSRYVNVDDSEFEYVVRENLPEKLKIHEQIFKNVTSHSIMYKHKNLSDDYEILWFYDEDKNNRFMCKYIFIDFSIVMQNKVSDCYKIENYKSKYPNKRMK